MSNNQNIKNDLEGLSKDAKRDIAWLAAIHVIIRSSQKKILPQATQLLLFPKNTLSIQNLPPAEAKRKHAENVKAFDAFCDYATEPPGQNPGHYLNKSAILYTDAILQAFLDRSYECVATHKNLPDKKLKKRSINGKLKELSGLSIDESRLKTAKHVKFLSQLRHIITHNNSFVDGKFLKNCGIDYPNTALAAGETPLWDTTIWPDENTFLKSYQPPSSNNQFQASLAIDSVIIPYLKHSTDFIEEILSEFIKATIMH
jgi:hypothetical protein